MTGSYLGAAAWTASPVVFAVNDIDGNHAPGWLHRGHTAVTGGNGGFGAGVALIGAEHAGALKSHGNAE